MINKTQEWTMKHGFTFSTDKTAAMIFHNKLGLQQEPSLKIGNININMLPEKKFLGLIYNQKLNWRALVEYIRRKGIKALDILKVLSHLSWGADRVYAPNLPFSHQIENRFWMPIISMSKACYSQTVRPFT